MKRALLALSLLVASPIPAHASAGQYRVAGLTTSMWSADLITQDARVFLLADWGSSAVVHDASPPTAQANAWFLVCKDECIPVAPDALSIVGSAESGRLVANLAGIIVDVTCTAPGQPKWFTSRNWQALTVGKTWVVEGSEFWMADPVLPTTGTTRGTCSGWIGEAEILAADLLAGTQVAGHSTITWR